MYFTYLLTHCGTADSLADWACYLCIVYNPYIQSGTSTPELLATGETNMFVRNYIFVILTNVCTFIFQS